MSTTSASGAAIPSFSFDATIGAILIGGFISVFLFGVTCLQTFIYYQRYPRDKALLKFIVLLIWVIDTLDTALAVQICYYYLITNYANPLAVLSPVWSLKLHVLLTSLSDFVVRSLYAQRIYTLSHRNKIITVIIGALSIVDLVVGTVITTKAFKIPTFAGLTAVANLFYVNFASNITADTCVALTLAFYLWRNKTGLTRPDSLVNKLIAYTVNTGLLTVLDASAGLISYAARPTTLIFIAFYLNLSKFYVNSYLATLNVRKTLMSSIRTDGAYVTVDISGINASHSMPAFRSISSGGADYLSSSAAPELLSMNTLDTSNTSRGDASTAVNTPIDINPSRLEAFKGVVGNSSDSDLKKNYTYGSMNFDDTIPEPTPSINELEHQEPRNNTNSVLHDK